MTTIQLNFLRGVTLRWHAMQYLIELMLLLFCFKDLKLF
jgi:hypothetical protein